MKCFRHLPEGLFLRKKAPTTAYLDPAFPLGRRHFPLSNSIPFSVADLAPVNWATFGLTSMHLRYTRKKAQTVSTATAISRWPSIWDCWGPCRFWSCFLCWYERWFEPTAGCEEPGIPTIIAFRSRWLRSRAWFMPALRIGCLLSDLISASSSGSLFLG